MENEGSLNRIIVKIECDNYKQKKEAKSSLPSILNFMKT